MVGQEFPAGDTDPPAPPRPPAVPDPFFGDLHQGEFYGEPRKIGKVRGVNQGLKQVPEGSLSRAFSAVEQGSPLLKKFYVFCYDNGMDDTDRTGFG